MKTTALFSLIVFLSLLVCPLLQANIITKGVREIVEAVYDKGTKEAAEALAEFGGEKAIQEALEKAAREGGDEVVEKVIRYGKRYGVAAIRVIDDAPLPYTNALDELPQEFVERALWAAQRNPTRVSQLVKTYGSDGLLVAAKHRGIGNDLVATLGDDALRLGKVLPEEKGIILARHADEIADLPPATRSKVVDAILSASSRTIDYIEKHPKVFLTATGVATFVALKDEILGTDEEVTIDPDGERTVRRRGFIERILNQFRRPIVTILSVVAVILAFWGGVKVWGAYRIQKLKVSHKEYEFQERRREMDREAE